MGVCTLSFLRFRDHITSMGGTDPPTPPRHLRPSNRSNRIGDAKILCFPTHEKKSPGSVLRWNEECVERMTQYWTPNHSDELQHGLVFNPWDGSKENRCNWQPNLKKNLWFGCSSLVVLLNWLFSWKMGFASPALMDGSTNLCCAQVHMQKEQNNTGEIWHTSFPPRYPHCVVDAGTFFSKQM